MGRGAGVVLTRRDPPGWIAENQASSPITWGYARQRDVILSVLVMTPVRESGRPRSIE